MSNDEEDLIMAKKAVFGMVATQEQVSQIVGGLQAAGFGTNDVSVLFPDTSGTHDFAHEKHTRAPEGAIAGASAGGALGGIVGLLAGVGAVAIPGLGAFIAAGPVMAALSGAAVGATVGGVTGALIGLGMSEVEAKRYEGKLREGKILLSVHTEDSAEIRMAKDILRRFGADNVTAIGEASVPEPKSAPAHR
jgi:hypothetical protein